MVIKNADIVLENEVWQKSCLRISNDRITEIGATVSVNKGEDIYDAQGAYVCPGFIDLHTHGCGGADFMDGSTSDIITAASAHARHGSTTILPTTVICKRENLDLFIENMKRLRDEGILDGKDEDGRIISKMPGIHFEGPFISPFQVGALNKNYIELPTRKRYMEIYDKCDGLMKRYSLAPEIDGAQDMIRELSSRGVLISAAHTSATYDDISKAYDNGLMMLTHFYSAMSSISRKEGFRILGVIECGYLMDDLYVEIIADGKHLPENLLHLIFKCKNHNRITACSDSMRGAGMPDGLSVIGPRSDGIACIIEDGVAKVMDKSCFAGSIATGDVLARTLINIVGLSLPEMSRILSLQPANLIGMGNEIGSICVGKKADLVILDKEMNVIDVFINGKRLEMEV